MYQDDVQSKFHLAVLDFLKHYCELGNDDAIKLYSGLSLEKDGKAMDLAMYNDLSIVLEKNIKDHELELESSFNAVKQLLIKYRDEFNFYQLSDVISDLSGRKDSEAHLFWKELFQKHLHENK